MLLGLPTHAADNDTIQVAVTEELEMTFIITSEANQTVKMGNGQQRAVDAATEGEVVVPATIDYDSRTYQVKTVSGYAFSGCTGITSVTIEDGITSVGQYAFNGCTALNSVTLPSGITQIATYTFNKCSALSSITIPEGVTSIGKYAFNACSGLKEVELPQSLTTISGAAFQNNSALQSLTIPANVKSIASYAFSGAKSLKTVYSKVATPFAFGSKAFNGINSLCGLHVPEGTKDAYIAKGWTASVFKAGVVEGDDTPTKGFAFTATTDEGVELTYVVTDVDNWDVSVGNGTSLAADASTIGSVTIPESATYETFDYHVTAIAAKAFASITSIEQITLPASLTSIGSQAFNGCTSLKTVLARMEPPFTLTADAFSNISNYCGLHVPEGTKTSYIEAGWTKEIFKGGVVEGDDALTGGYIFTQANAEGIAITYVVVDIDELTVQVGDDKNTAVANDITGEIIIPATVTAGGQTYKVTTIGSNAFNGCTGITGVSLPEGLNTIASNAFSGCTGLTEFTLPATLTSLGPNAFSDCSNLTKVLSRIEAPFKLTANSFASVAERCSLHVPEGTKSAYTEAGWTNSVFKGGVVEGDNTLLVGDSFVIAEAHGVDIIYVVSDADNKYVKVGDGTNTAIKADASGDITLPETVEFEGETYIVTSISANAFKGCTGIRKVEIDANITSIGNYAFNGCTALSAIKFPETLTSIGQYTFKECESLKTIDFPESITSLGREAFSYSGLTSVTIPKGVTSMSYAVFADCYYMTTVVLPSTLKSVGQQAFRHNLRLTNLTISEGVTSLGKHAFYNCQSLKEVTLPSTLTSCNTNVFYYCVSLTKVIARMENPFTLPTAMFDECPATLSLHIPDGTYDKYAAAGWVPEKFPGGIVYGDDTPTLNETFTFKTIEGVEVTAVLTDIENQTIQVGMGTTGNPAIDQSTEGIVTLPDTVEAFGNKYVITTIGGYAFRYCNSVTEVKIPATVSHIGRYGFGNMDNLTKAVLPDSLKAMETAAFYHDNNLKELTLNEGLEDIGNYAFSYAAIEEVEIPKSVTNIGRNSFAACSQLDKVVSRIEEPYAFQSDAFTAISATCGLHVPDGTKEAYIEQGWTEDVFPGGIVYGDLTLHKGQSFEVTDEEGTVTTYRVTDVNDNKVEIVSVKAGEDTDGCLTIAESVTDPVAGNDYTVGSIANGAFKEELKAVYAETEEPFEVTENAFPGIGDKCVLFVPKGTKDSFIANGWTEEIFKGGVYEERIPGDVNEDLSVDISDIVAVINTIADPDGSTFCYADVNEDDTIDISDIVKIINIIAASK